MSIELGVQDRTAQELSSQVSLMAAELCSAQGIAPNEAHTIGERGAQYAAEIIFKTLAELKLLSTEGLDEGSFLAVAHRITDEAIADR